MKVAYLIPEFPQPGHTFIWREVQAVRRHGIEVHLFSTRRPAAEPMCHAWSAQVSSQTCYLFPPSVRSVVRGAWELLSAGPAGWWRCLKAVLLLRDESFLERLRVLGLILVGAQFAGEVRSRQLAHVHVHMCSHAAYVAMFAHLLAGIPYSLALHGRLANFGGGQRQKWRHASFGVAVAGRLRADLVRDLSISALNIEVAPMGVDASVFQRSAPYEPANPDGELRLVTCGRLHYAKGHHDLIQAVHQLRRSGEQVTLTILGNGPAEDELKRQIAELGLEGSVVLAGAVSEDVVRRTLESAHLFCLASLDEAVNVATMEAMAMSLPVVVTAVGGQPELVRDGVDGLIVPPSSPPVLAAAIRRISQNPDMARRFGQSGRERIRTVYHTDVSAKAVARRLGMDNAAGQPAPAAHAVEMGA